MKTLIFTFLLLGQSVQPITENPWLTRSKELHGKLTKIVEASIAKNKSVESIINKVRDINPYITDEQVLRMISRLLPSERYNFHQIKTYLLLICFMI